MIKIQTTLPKEKRSSKKKKGKRIGFTVLLVLGILLIFALAFGFWLYKTVMSPNVQTADGKDVELFIPTGSDYEQVKAILQEANCIINEKSFNWVAQKKERSLCGEKRLQQQPTGQHAARGLADSREGQVQQHS